MPKRMGWSSPRAIWREKDTKVDSALNNLYQLILLEKFNLLCVILSANGTFHLFLDIERIPTQEKCNESMK
jgi:hypothetical protein